MFERFTTSARAIVIRAQQEARDLQDPVIGTHHLVLAMIENDGVASVVLREAGITADTVRAGARRATGATGPLLTEQESEALRSVGIDADAVLARIETTFGPEALRPPPRTRRSGWFGRVAGGGHIPFGPRAKKVLELSLREALRLKSKEIGSGHLLLGVLRDGEGLAAQLMHEHGVQLDDLRARTEQALRNAA